MEDVLIWDGEEFKTVDRETADSLKKSDKAQILSDGFIDGMSLKYRSQFTGYKTREMRAERPEPEAPPPAGPSREDLEEKTVVELREIASELDISYSGLKKAELIDAILAG